MTSSSGSGTDLSISLIRESLSSLGKHPFTLSHDYLALTVIDKDIRCIKCIKDYPNLMHIDLSDNLIEDLTPLGNLSALVQLKARNNQLKECLTFAPKRCSTNSAWSEGQKAVGSMLAMVDLSGNQIEEIGDLVQHKFLECLILSSNKISKISGLESLKYLQILDLSYNKICNIECLEGLLIIELNLEGNEITSLQGLDQNPRLSVLNVAKNRISSLAPLSSCTQLHNLKVGDNLISKIRQVEFLEGLRWLRHLNLSGNPCCSKQYYRSRVVFRLSTLQELDVSTISSEERIRSNNLYDADGGDTVYRQAVLAKYYPEEQFENFSPYFEDDEQNLELSDLYDKIEKKDENLLENSMSGEEYAVVKSVTESFIDEILTAVCNN